MSSHGLLLTNTAPTELYPLSLHDALPIYRARHQRGRQVVVRDRHGPAAVTGREADGAEVVPGRDADGKSTRVNSRHRCSSYAVLCREEEVRLFGRHQVPKVRLNRGDVRLR